MSDMTEKGSDFVRDLGEAARQNPLSAALIGMGVLWLFTGGSAVSRAGDLVRRTGGLADAAGEAFDSTRSHLTSAAASVGDGVNSATQTLRDSSAGAIDTV